VEILPKEALAFSWGPPGELERCVGLGKPSFLIGKSTISMAIFNSKLWKNTRGYMFMGIMEIELRSWSFLSGKCSCASCGIVKICSSVIFDGKKIWWNLAVEAVVALWFNFPPGEICLEPVAKTPRWKLGAELGSGNKDLYRNTSFQERCHLKTW